MVRHYLDYASAAPLGKAVVRAMSKALTLFGNPSAPHAEGRAARAAIEAARGKIAASLRVKPHELVFTSGGTESNTLAILGTVSPGQHVVTSTIEHSSVLAAVAALERRGALVTRVSPSTDGLLSADVIVKALTPKTVLVTLAHVNSEIGVVQSVADIGRAIKKYSADIVFHVDAAQSPLYLDASPHALQADLVSYDAQKVLGPKGAGVLYRDYAVPLMPIVGGGSQEKGMRPGTENTVAIVGAGVAFAEAAKNRSKNNKKVTELRNYGIALIKKELPEFMLIGSTKHRIANNINIALARVDADYLTVLLDAKGFAVTPRSACVGSGGARSEVVYALTHDDALARGTLRITLGPNTIKATLRAFVATLKKVLPLAQKKL